MLTDVKVKKVQKTIPTQRGIQEKFPSVEIITFLTEGVCSLGHELTVTLEGVFSLGHEPLTPKGVCSLGHEQTFTPEGVISLGHKHELTFIIRFTLLSLVMMSNIILSSTLYKIYHNIL